MALKKIKIFQWTKTLPPAGYPKGKEVSLPASRVFKNNHDPHTIQPNPCLDSDIRASESQPRKERPTRNRLPSHPFGVDVRRNNAFFEGVGGEGVKVVKSKFMERQKQLLLQFFTVSVAAFDFAQTIATATGKPLKEGFIESMQREILAQLQKQDADMDWVDKMLDRLQREVERMAEERAANTMLEKFAPGGMVSKSLKEW